MPFLTGHRSVSMINWCASFPKEITIYTTTDRLQPMIVFCWVCRVCKNSSALTLKIKRCHIYIWVPSTSWKIQGSGDTGPAFPRGKHLQDGRGCCPLSLGKHCRLPQAPLYPPVSRTPRPDLLTINHSQSTLLPSFPWRAFRLRLWDVLTPQRAFTKCFHICYFI